MSQPPPTAAPVAEIERRLQWRVLALAGFLALIVGLAALAALSLLVPARVLSGLPDDPDVAAGRALLHDRLPVRVGALRFASALTGEAPAGARFGPEQDALAERAARDLERARARRRGDPRLAVALAHLDLARAAASPPDARTPVPPERLAAWLRLVTRAERRYRAVTERGADVPEARLGLGVTLALEALAERDPLRARGLELEAIAQWAAVNPRDPAILPALYDRALLLVRVGRRAEGERAAREYLARDATSAWARRLRESLGLAGA